MKIQLSEHFTYKKIIAFCSPLYYHDDLHFDL